MADIDTSTAAIAALLDGVTDGPWQHHESHFYGPDPDRFLIGQIVGGGAPFFPNLRFILAARQLVPALLARAEQAEAERDEWRKTAMNKIEMADSTALRVRDATIATLTARVAELEAADRALRTALDAARTKDREPDFCYDDEWEYTMGWDQRFELVDGADLTEPMPIYTLYKGPTKWAVEIHVLDQDGDIEDSEIKVFDTENAARAALSREGGE